MDILTAHRQARDSDTPLVVDTEAGGTRNIAEIYRLTDGRLLFLDVGWADPGNPGHTAHALPAEGDPEGPPWIGDDYVIRVADSAFDGALLREWAQWLQARKGLRADRETGRSALRAAGYDIEGEGR